MTSTKDNSVDRRSGKDRRSSNRPKTLQLVDRLEGVKNSLSEKERALVQNTDRNAEQGVRLKFEFECSERLAQDLVDGIAYFLQERNSQKRLRDPSEALSERMHSSW